MNYAELEMGKLPPQAIELEEAVLGAMMLENDVLEEIFPKLNNELWYRDGHRLIFEAIKILHLAKAPVDILTVTNKLKEQENLEFVGGAHYISQLTSKIASSSNIEYHIAILTQKALRRKQIANANETIIRAYDETIDVFDSISQDTKRLSELENYIVGDQTEFNITTSIQSTIKHLMKPKKYDYPGLSTGNLDLSMDIGGFQPGDLIYLGARPSEGKTDAMLNHVFHLALQNIPVAIFSLETKIEHKINIRLLSYFSGIDNRTIASGKWDSSQREVIGEAEQRISSLPIYMFDNPYLTPNTFRNVVRKLIKDKGIKMAFGDYIQLARPDEKIKGNREEAIASISRNLKTIALELNIPVMWLAQLSRAMLMRNGLNRRPSLGDFRESGSLEQDAEVVMTLFGPERNGIDFESWNTEGAFNREYYPDIVERSILKNKNGPADKILVEYYHKPTSKFSNQPLIINQGIAF